MSFQGDCLRRNCGTSISTRSQFHVLLRYGTDKLTGYQRKPLQTGCDSQSPRNSEPMIRSSRLPSVSTKKPWLESIKIERHSREDY